MKATREAFGDKLVEYGSQDENIVVVSADLSKATKATKFGKEFPERFFELGIAENNMIGVASGISEYGYKVFISSFASFLTGKYDTIRCSISYSNAPVVIVGSHVGMAIGRDGVTQMGLEDVSLMRSLPDMVIFNPASYNECKSMMDYICENDLKTPHYLRLGRQPVKEIFSDDYEFTPNKATVHRVSTTSRSVVFTTGCVTPDVLEASENLDVDVVGFPTLKPIDRNTILKFKNFNNIITIEDHSIVGGLGSIISEVMAEEGFSAKLTRIGLNDQFPESGSPTDLYEKYGLSANKLTDKIDNIINEH